MIRYKRQAPYRYEFQEPIPTFFKIVKIDGEAVESSEGLAEMINISIRGMKISLDLHIPDIEIKSIQLTIRFSLNKKEFIVNGVIVWNQDMGNRFEYGIELLVDQHVEQEITDQMIIYAKNAVLNK